MSRDHLVARLSDLLPVLYPDRSTWTTVRDDLVDLADDHADRLDGRQVAPPDEGTSYVITYGDAFRRTGQAPLQTLREVLREHVGDAVSDVHLLPLYPSTSDDGFAVVDHRQVDPDLGTWADVEAITAAYPAMVDLVANHVSSSSPWFTGWLAGDPALAGYVVGHEPGFDTSRVVRPRTSPLFHHYRRPDGSLAQAWTTFGPDQVDVDLGNPRVLLDLTDVLLGYLGRGATAVRLDAVGFLWKESGTTCLHLPQTHAVIKVWRAVVDHVAPGTRLLTETNVPHAENVSYFGGGDDEAHMVYQFALPPLVLHSFVVGDTTALNRWATTVGPVGPTATWFNLLASHDGIGMRPVEGMLSAGDVQRLVRRTLDHGGRVSMATAPDGTQAVYELNIGFLDALVGPGELHDEGVVVANGLAAHSILLSVVGVPAVYHHSLFGSCSDHEGMHDSGISRRINRRVMDADELAQELTHRPRRRSLLAGLLHMLRTRREQPAFSPFAPQRVVYLDARVFAVRRLASDGAQVLSVTNVTGQEVDLPGVHGTDLLTGRPFPSRLGPWGYAWVLPHARD